MKCSKCESTRTSKNNHRRGRQAYLCKDCGCQFLESYLSQGYSNDIRQLCLKRYVNGMGFRAIERVTNINHNTIINWVKQAAQSLPDTPEYSEIPETAEADELQMFVGCKKNKV